MFKAINEANEVLSNEQKRTLYDIDRISEKMDDMVRRRKEEQQCESSLKKSRNSYHDIPFNEKSQEDNFTAENLPRNYFSYSEHDQAHDAVSPNSDIYCKYKNVQRQSRRGVSDTSYHSSLLSQRKYGSPCTSTRSPINGRKGIKVEKNSGNKTEKTFVRSNSRRMRHQDSVHLRFSASSAEDDYDRHLGADRTDDDVTPIKSDWNHINRDTSTCINSSSDSSSDESDLRDSGYGYCYT